MVAEATDYKLQRKSVMPHKLSGAGANLNLSCFLLTFSMLGNFACCKLSSADFVFKFNFSGILLKG